MHNHTSHLYFSFVLDPYMTVRLLNSEIFTTSWRMCICSWGGSAALTQHLSTLPGIICTSHAKICWDLLQQHNQQKRERWHLLPHCRLLSPRLKDRFIYKERGKHRIELKMMVLLYDMHAWMVGVVHANLGQNVTPLTQMSHENSHNTTTPVKHTSTIVAEQLTPLATWIWSIQKIKCMGNLFKALVEVADEQLSHQRIN